MKQKLYRLSLVIKALPNWCEEIWAHPEHFIPWAWSNIFRTDLVKTRQPWLTYGAVDFISKWKNMMHWRTLDIFEWGSGGSTSFFRSMGIVVSVEDDPWWAQKTGAGVRGGLNYPLAIDEWPYNFFDVVLVDGSYRNSCIAYAIPHLKKGGILILDNSDDITYRDGIALLDGFERYDFTGAGPLNAYFWTTSIFIKNNNTPHLTSCVARPLRHPLPPRANH